MPTKSRGSRTPKRRASRRAASEAELERQQEQPVIVKYFPPAERDHVDATVIQTVGQVDLRFHRPVIHRGLWKFRYWSRSESQ